MSVEHAGPGNWRSSDFREKIVQKLEAAMQNAVVPLSLNGDARTVEEDIFRRSNSYEVYLEYVSRVLCTASGVQNSNNQAGNQPTQMYSAVGNQGQMPPYQQMGQQRQMEPMRMQNSAPIMMGQMRSNRPVMQPNFTGQMEQHRLTLTQQDVRNITDSLSPEMRAQVNQMSNPEKQQFFMKCKYQSNARMAAAYGPRAQQPNYGAMPPQQQMNMPQQQGMSMSSPMMNSESAGMAPQYRARMMGPQGPMSMGRMPQPSQPQQMNYGGAGGQMAMPSGPDRGGQQAGLQGQQMGSNSAQQPHMTAYGQPGSNQPSSNSQNGPAGGHMPPNSQTYQVPSPMVPGPSPGFSHPSPGGYSVPTHSASRVGEVAPSPSGRMSSGPPSVGPISGAASDAADDPAYREKVADLQRFYEPLKKMLEEKGDQAHSQSSKFASILDILDYKRRVTVEVLLKCEDVLKRLGVGNPPEKHSEGSLFQPLLDVLAQCAAHRNGRDIIKRSLELPEYCIPELEIRSPRSHLKKIKLETNVSAESLDTSLTRVKTELKEENEEKDTVNVALLNTPVPAEGERAEPKPVLNATVTREVAMLESRFRIQFDHDHLSANKNGIDIVCDLGDKDLPCVPPLRLSIPDNYPLSSPKCDRELTDYVGTPFLESIRSMLAVKMARMGKSVSLTSLLDTWETGVRQACLLTSGSY